MPFEGNHSDAGITWKPSTPTKAGALERFTSGPDYLCEFGSTGFQRLFQNRYCFEEPAEAWRQRRRALTNRATVTILVTDD